MGKWSGQRRTDSDVLSTTQAEIRLILKRVLQSEIDPPDATRLLVDVVWKAANSLTRAHETREGVTHEPQ